jgi:uncharacterized protein YqjF (DUF2071 family)
MTSSWQMRQRWNDLLFEHWPVEPGALRRLIPASLQLEEFDGTPWVAVTPFWISGMGMGPVPMPPFSMPELNVRTYVTEGSKPGVWFLSLDAASGLAVMGAHALYRLPYVHARMKTWREGELVRYQSARDDGTSFEASYQATGPAVRPDPGSFDHWCVERYCLYTGGPGRSLWRADIEHEPWALAPATLTIERNDMLTVHGLTPSGAGSPPRMALPLDVTIGPLRRVRLAVPSAVRS